MKFTIINGPNLNLLGQREPEIYGKDGYQALVTYIQNVANEENIEVVICQSNYEGELINFVHEAFFEKADGIIINPAAYTHTSVALLDALKAVNLPAVEVHLSNIHQREEFRHHSFTAAACIGQICGFGIDGYRLAMLGLKSWIEGNAS